MVKKREMGRGGGVCAGKEREEKEMIRTRDPENVSAYPGNREYNTIQNNYFSYSVSFSFFVRKIVSQSDFRYIGELCVELDVDRAAKQGLSKVSLLDRFFFFFMVNNEIHFQY